MYEDLARRLAAAYISHKLGYKGIDTVLKRLEKEEIGQSWIQLAEFVVKNTISPVDQLFQHSQKSDDQILKLLQGFTKNPFN